MLAATSRRPSGWTAVAMVVTPLSPDHTINMLQNSLDSQATSRCQHVRLAVTMPAIKLNTLSMGRSQNVLPRTHILLQVRISWLHLIL
jgi:hypothetical protein